MYTSRRRKALNALHRRVLTSAAIESRRRATLLALFDELLAKAEPTRHLQRIVRPSALLYSSNIRRLYSSGRGSNALTNASSKNSVVV